MAVIRRTQGDFFSSPQLHFLFLLMTLVLGLGTACVETEVQNQTAVSDTLSTIPADN